VEAASGWQPDEMAAELDDALGKLIIAWRPVRAAEKTTIVDQVAEAVDKGKLARLAALSVSSSAGAGLLAAAMSEMAETATARMIEEAASQGVTIDPARVKVDSVRLKSVASARAALASAYVTQQAGTKALQVVAASAGTDAGDIIDVFIDDLSDVSLRDQLAAALHAAQNAGRVGVLKAAPASAGKTVAYTATEFLDHNTCQPCMDIDGHVFGDLAEAEAAYVNGGYVKCLGGLRCRGTVLADWGGVSVT